MPRTILITGGGTGIGLAMARVFVTAGDKVIIVGRREPALQMAVQELNHSKADYVVADLSKPDEVSKLRETLHQKHIQAIDVLINNAGASTPRQGDSLQEIAEQHIKNYEANVLSAALTTEALRDLITSPNGRIINLSSIAALRGGGPAYSAAKAAIIGWSYALANELEPKHITVNVIAPGYVPDTEFFGDTMTTERHERLVSQTQLSRAGTPHEIASTAFFLASQEAGYITGQVIRVDGGALVR